MSLLYEMPLNTLFSSVFLSSSKTSITKLSPWTILSPSSSIQRKQINQKPAIIGFSGKFTFIVYQKRKKICQKNCQMPSLWGRKLCFFSLIYNLISWKCVGSIQVFRGNQTHYQIFKEEIQRKGNVAYISVDLLQWKVTQVLESNLEGTSESKTV